MAKRISKKLLFGLGSSLTFGTIGTIAGFGIKSIINQVNSDLGIANLAINALAETTFDNAPNYNKAEQSMFINTANLKSFHFGNTQKGQTVTPYGWLGVFEDSAVKKNRIALTSWGGEILWVNEDYASDTTSTYNVYDMKYDFNTDLIFVVRTPSNNGMFMDNGDIAPLQMDVLNARTGQRVYNKFNADYFRNLQTSAKARMEQIFLDNSGSWRANRDRLESLYYLDIASKKGTNEVLISYIPKFTQLVQRKRLKGNVNASDGEPAKGSAFIANDKTIKLVSVKEFVDSWHKMAISIRYDNSIKGHWTKNYKLRKAAKSIDDSNSNWSVRANISGDSLRNVSMEDYFLLINPFFTISSNNNFIFHFVAAKSDGTEVIHKMITFRRDGSSDGTGNNGIVNGSDKTQYVGARSIYSFQLPSFANFTSTWGFADRWSNLISNANLLPNKNMFDNNSIVTAYPYASDLGARAGKGLPIFSVQQILVNPDENGGGKFYDAVAPNVFETNVKNTFNYNFGENIINYYRRNMNNYNRPNINNIYPWPTSTILGSSDINTSNIDHFYNRLISVSPFDNTIVYAAKPNVKNGNFDMSIRNTDKAATFWIGSRNKATMAMNTLLGPRLFRPFVVTNWADNANQLAPIDTRMTNYKSLYRDGITFDIFSTTADSNNRTHLNLYFNNTGSSKNDNYNGNGMVTSKIGLLDDVLADDPNFWTHSVSDLYSNTISGVNANQYIQKINSKLNRQSYSTLIHSRANLETWFARTWQNNTSAANMYPNNFRLNGEETSSKRAEAKTFGNKLTNQGNLLSSQESVDLVSHWEDKASNTSAPDKTPPNYSRLAIKRPKISVKGSKEGILPVEISYDLANRGTDFFTKPGWGFDRDHENEVIFKKSQEIRNASYEILTTLGQDRNQQVISAIGSTTDNLNISSEDLSKPIWVDARKIPDQNQAKFGFINNNLPVNNKKPLRLMIKIIKPGGNLPAWFNSIDQNIFSRPYPVQKVGNETSIGEVLTELAKQKAQKIKFTDNGTENTAVGFGNLKLEAYLGLNPDFVNSGNKLYTNGTTKLLVDQNNDQSIIYNDRFESLKRGSRILYDQSQIQYSSFNGGGFNTSNTKLWKSGVFDVNKKLNVSVDYDLIPDTLVRQTAGSNDPIFDFSYKSGTNNILELRPKNPDWFRKTFTNLNRMTNLFMLFQFRTDSDTLWQNLVPTEGTGGRSFYYDNEAAAALSNNVFTIKTNISNITKLRIKLTPTSKYISASHSIALQAIEVNKSWILSQQLSNASNSLADISATDITNYETQVLNSISDTTKRAAVKLVYSFDGGNFDLDAAALAEKIKQKFTNFTDNNQGVFALWNGTNGSKLIKAKFALKTNDGKYKLTVAGNENPNDADLSNDVKSTIKSKIDLSDYISELQSNKIVAQMGNASGTIQSGTINIPGKNSSGRFQNKKFNEIKSILENQVGVKIKFQKQQQNGTWDSTWSDDLNQITTYSTSDPKFRIGFFAQSNYNVEILNGTTVISNNGNPPVELKLNLPKVITIDNTAVTTFRGAHGLGGNTKNLTSDLTKITKLIDDIKKSQANTSIPDINNAPLQVLFQLGGNGDYQTIDQLKTTLQGTTTDQTSNQIKIKFRIDPNAANQADWMISPVGDYTILNPNNTDIPIFVHDAGIFNKIKTETSVSGTNTNLTWRFPTDPNFAIDNDGVFNNSKKNGKGLKLEFTTNEGLDVNADTGWGSKPTTVPTGTTKVFVRIITQNNQYIYQKKAESNNEKITINLDQIRQLINLQSSWLNRPLVTSATDIKSAITVANLTNYEESVMNGITTLDAATKAKLVIKYHVGNSANPVDKNGLVDLVNNYTNGQTFNILQLWNGTSGVKINAVFAKKEEQGLYDLVYPQTDPRYQELNTSQITTTINFDKVIKWLTTNTTKVPVKTVNNKVQLAIPNIPDSIGDSIFANKTWENIQNLFSTKFGITIQYRSVTANNINASEQDWSDSWQQLNPYDQNIGKFQIRFKLDAAKSKNIKLKLTDSLTADGSTANTTGFFTGYMAIKLMVKVNPQFTSQFNSNINANVVRGNTRNLTIDQSAEADMLNKIKQENVASNTAFNNLILEVRYQLGEWQVGDQGKTRQEFETYLASQTNVDQNTNKITFKISVSQAQNSDFAIADSNYILHDHERPTTNTKIKYFVNKKTWETNADGIKVTGTNNNLSWNFSSFSQVREENGFVYLRNEAGNALQLQFTTKANADYADPANQVSDNLAELNSKWITKKPTSIPAGVSEIKVRIVPTPGFEYEPATLTNNDKARVHAITPTITTEIRVNKTWFTEKPLSANAIDISALSVQAIQQWEASVYKKIQDTNNVSDQIARKIQIKYIFNDDANNKLNGAQELKNKIDQLSADFNGTDLGIVQLWNSTSSKGKKIHAIFESGDPKYALKVDGVANAPTENDLKAQVNTDNIFTTISMVKYIEVLKTEKTTAQTDPQVLGKLVDFTPPPGKNPNAIFHGKTYDQIAAALRNTGVKIEFSKDKNTWQTKEQTKEYDVQKNALYLRFTIESANIKLQLDSTNQIGPNVNSGNFEIRLPLNVPKYITIDENQAYWNLTSQFNFAGNTKNITFDQAKINEFITQIKSTNANAGGDQEYNNAPLEILFQVGSNSQFKKPEELKQYLLSEANNNVDRTDRAIKFKFQIQPGQEANWKLSTTKTYTLLEDSSTQNQVKIFINDAGMFDKLKKMTIAGDQQNLVWNWPFGQNGIDPNTGVLTPTAPNNFGKGLKIQFTFDPNATTEGAAANQWSSKVPTSFDSKYDKVWLRIKLTNDTLYTYEHINEKFSLSLTEIQKTIKVDTNWLKIKFKDGQELALDSFNDAVISEYETKVIEKAKTDPTNPVAPNLVDKFKINYQFDNETTWVDKAELIKKITQYKANNAQDSFGILQLWNGVSGVKIKAKLVDANANDKYNIQVLNGPDHTIDTTNILTTIDFSSVLSWLKQLEVPIEEATGNRITKLKIPNIDSKIQIFGSKTWDQVQTTLSSLFGITILYSNNVPNEAENWGAIGNVNKYNPKQPSFKIKFKTDGSKSKNIKFKLATNEELNGASVNESQVSVINIKAKLLVEIPQNLLDTFKASANITGNTKNITITDALAAETTLIKAIITYNKNIDNRYEKLDGKLEIHYALTDQPNGNNTWKKLSEFQADLAAKNNDQTTNQIFYKFVLTDQTNFSISANDTNPRVLSDKQPSTTPNLKIKYYVNPANWEANAAKVQITGTSDNLEWNFDNIFGAAKVTERDGKVYLRNDAGEAIQVFFTTNPNLNYSNNQTSDNLSDLATKWISKKPTAINAATNVLKIKLVANTGFVYGPAEAGATPPAKEHNVTINIQKILYVNKDWFNSPLVSAPLEISALNKAQHLDLWETNVYQQLARQNQVDETIARKVNIKYFFDNQIADKFNAEGLIQKITQLRTDYNNADLGILQLWNGTKGKKLNAIFESGDSSYAIRVQGNSNAPTEDQIKNQLNTNNIFTNVSLVEYIKTLKTSKTRVTLDDPNRPGTIRDFTPPSGANNGAIFSGKTYDQIAQRLKDIGVKIEFSKDKQAPWKPKEEIKDYNIQLNSLYLRFTVESSNIKLQLDATTQIGNGQNSDNFEIRLPLQVPKYILINQTKPYWNLTNEFGFSGTTKNIQFVKAKIDKFLEEIKKDNATSGSDPSYNSAPLEIHFQVGTGSDFVEISKLDAYLQSQPDDLPDRIVKFKFALKAGTSADDWKIQNENDEYQLLNDQDQKNKIKLYINDKGVFNELKAMSISGTNDQLVWNWPALVAPVIDENTGILNPAAHGSNFGKGLKFEFTFKANPNINAPLGTNPETEWVAKVPKTYDANKGFTHVYLRVKLTNESYYAYDYLNQLVTISLDKVSQKIILRTEWLEKQFNNGQSLTLEQLDAGKIDQYEQAVKQAAKAGGIADSLLDKFMVKYQFNFTGTENDQELVDKNGLLTKINQYKANNNQQSFGLLQLWNGVAGVKIIAKFADANPADKFAISVNDNPQYKILNNQNVISTIDFNAVLDWLKTLEVEIDEQPNYVIAKLKIPAVKAEIPTFGSKSWNDVETALALFGITIQYSNSINGQPENWGPIANVNKYDPKKPNFKIKFKLDGSKSKNIKFKVNKQELNGASATESSVSTINIKAKLLVEIPQNLLNTFKTTANITGNTKNIIITDAQSAETKLIQEIIEFNKKIDNRYEKLTGKLELHYALTDQVDNATVWKKLNDFKTDLAAKTNDQTTNKIQFKIVLTDQTNFIISTNDASPQILSDKKPATDPDIKIKYYVNASDWETKAGKIQVTGTSDNLEWNFSSIFGNKLAEKDDGKVYLRNDAGEAIQVFFTTNANADYNNPQTSDDLNELANKWVSKKPTTINAATQNLKIKLVAANSGYVYGPAENGASPAAKAHDVNINIKKVLYVDKEWFRPELVSTQMDISALQKTNLDSWENQVYTQLANSNQVDQTIAKKVNIKYFFEDNKAEKLSAEGLIQKINQLRMDYNNADLGILQLWNGTKGKKLYAIFESGDNQYIIKIRGSQNSPTEDQISNQLDTAKIFTTVSMTEYIKVLKTDKTTVALNTAAGPGKITSFTPPNGKNVNGIFNGKTYQQISDRLKAIGIKIEFSKDNKTNWVQKEQINEYDIQLNSLYLRFTVESSNIKLQLDANNQIGNGQNSAQMEIRLPLQVPKYIIINNTKDYWKWTDQFAFSGTTKSIEFAMDKITKFLEEIKKDNATSGNDPDYNNAPLEIKFQVGTGSQFTEISKLKAYLNGQTDDLPDRIIKFKFALRDGTNPNDWKIQNENDEYQLLNDQDPKNKVKLYINDKGVFEQLKAMVITGTNTALEWKWPELVKPPVLDEQSGILNPDQVVGKNFGKGLKFEFTFNKNHQAAQVGQNPETDWVAAVPKSYDANKGFTNVYLRIKLTRDDYYVYDHANKTITLSLDQVGQKLILKAAWLNKQFNNGAELNLENLTAEKIKEYENKVKENAQNDGIDQSLLDKFNVKFFFNFVNNVDENQLVDAAGLLEKINAYQANKNDIPFGILQLWNQSSGIKIVAKFVDANESDKYQIEVTGQPDYQIIDTSNVITTIDFIKVINWLTTTKKLVKVIGSNPNVTFEIPAVSATDDQTFNGKEWSKVSQALLQMGITVQYREVLNTTTPAESDWKDNINELKRYDENIGKIAIRFKFDQRKSINIKLKTSTNKTYNGKTDPKTEGFDLSLAIQLVVKIDDSLVNSLFVQKEGVISGNTKYLNINKTDHNELIKQIIKINEANNPEFKKSGLTLEFKLDQQIDNKWKTLDTFINDLKSATQDQRSNKVLFRFAVTNTEDFQVDSKERALFDPTSEKNPDNWKVKLFINNANWETQASGVQVSGKTSALSWNWNGLIVTEQNGKVGTNGLQIEFSAKNGASYNDPAAVETGDLKTQWILQKPTTLDPTIKTLYIRIKAKAGYVYGPAYTDQTNGVTANAKAHQVRLNIKREIVVNPKALLTSLSMDGTDGFVNSITKDILERFVNEGLNQIAEPTLREHVTVKFNFNGKKALDSTALLKEIKAIIESNDPSEYGILQLWNGIQGTKIEAYYDLVDPNGEYELITNDSTDPKQAQTVVTGHIQTKIDLMEIISDFKNQKIEFEPSDNNKVRNLITIKKWKMPQTKSGANALHGISWDAFENRLQAVGVAIKARIVNNPDTNPDWKPLSELKQYNDSTLQLAFRFEIQASGSNIVLSVATEGDTEYNPNGNSNSSEFKMSIKAPARVNVSESLVNTFKTNYQISGNTKNIQLDQNAETTLIEAIANENIAINPDVFKDLKSRLSVEYYLGKTPNDTNSQWLKRQEFIDWLDKQTNDQTTNEVWFRLAVTNPTGDDEAQTFNIDQSPKQLSVHDISENAKIKIFINDNGLENRAKNLKATGSTEAVTISGWDSFKNSMPSGLKAQWSNKATPNEATDDDWTEEPPTTLDANKNLWIRFKSEAGYVYEKAIKDANNNNNYTKYSQKQAISTDGLKVILKVKKEWLKKVQITNNTSDPQINEEPIKPELTPILPTGKDGLIELKYRIKGTNDWLLKEAFISKLKGLKGAKDVTNFILKREEIEIRYAIKAGEDEYALNIDGQNVDSNNEANFYLQLINDAEKLNDSFEGYINVDLVKDFKKDNFKIQGSTTKPSFIITNRQQLETALMPYAGKHLFDIQYSTEFKNNQWTWKDNQSILNDDGTLISETGLINKVQIGPDKKFALRFISKNTKYSVYQANKKQDDGYVLDLSDNVKITIEITNPFSAAGKTLGVWTREGKQAKYYQSEGGFKIVVANKSNYEVETPDNPTSAQSFLASSGLAQNEKNALEFVYHVFGSNPTQNEIDQIQKTINDHGSKDWTSFNKKATKSDSEWTENLGLKVGDYVAVAIRVKQEFSNGDNAFVLKDNDYSMILPVMQSGNNTYRPGRVAGYKVKTSDVDIESGTVGLISMVDPELPPLDGWTLLSKLNLKQDQKGNYLGVDLDLQLYSEYYKKTGSNEIWISGSGQKLVKRQTTTDDPTLQDSGKVYKDGQGNSIKDENNQDIKIYKTTKNRLSNPKKASGVTKTQSLENLGNGGFRLDIDKLNNQDKGLLSLFRNQDVDLKLKAHKGQGTDDWPDFYLDKDDKIIELKNIISPKIKYPIENENKISYSWNYEDFSSENIEYDKVGSNSKPEDGAAKIKTIFKLLRKEGTADKWTEITDTTSDKAAEKINQTLKTDFQDQLKFQLSRTRSNGGGTDQDSNNIYQFSDLRNKDRIVLKIVAKEDDLYYVEAPRPLIINVNGLTEAAPGQEKLQHLRVQQSGLIDGQGSFKVLVSDPANPDEDERTILKGWKFMVRVWDKDETLDEHGKRKIKINWTDDQSSIKNLENGDKVEWKLVSENGNPVKDAYYNTIALEHKTNPADGSITYNFAQVNYPHGNSAYDQAQLGIGAYPEDDQQYPETSGFVISGLKDKFEIFRISKTGLEKALSQLQPTYVGMNTQGTIHFDPKYFEQEYWVNTEGQIYTQAEKPNIYQDQAANEVIEISLIDFIKHVTFYTKDPVIVPFQNGFKFNGNDTSINNHLTNGDHLWAKFDMLDINDDHKTKTTVESGLENSVIVQLADVSGLKDIIDPMSPLWYVLMALAGIATLGTAAIIAFLISRHKKLKGKN